MGVWGGGGGGGGGGGDVVVQCTFDTLEEAGFDKDTLTPEELATLPPECAFLAAPPIVGLFILGTETDDLGNLKLYVHGVNKDFSPMTLADFEQASVTLDGVPANPAATVAPAPDGVLSIALLADYSLSISEEDVIGMGALFDTVVDNAPTDFEAEKINFSSEEGTASDEGATVITVKPGELPHWTESLTALKAANVFDVEQDRNNTTLYDAMGTGLMGPLVDKFDPRTDNLGLVERNGPLGVVGNRPATLIMVQTDGIDTASRELVQLDEVTGLLDRCHTTAIMMGTFPTRVEDALKANDVLKALAGDRGAFIQALNTNFIRPAMEPYVKSLGNLVVFTLSSDTGFEGSIVRIEVDGLGRDAVEPFDIDGNCQLL